ncbi:MAG TPA: hypothetical protein VIT20_09755 [Propionibacteriaceae bacterium]
MRPPLAEGGVVVLEVLHGGMLLTSACGVGCSALLDRRARLAAVLAGLVMLAAMVDMAVGHVFLSPATWACLLLVSAAATTFLQLHRQPGHAVMAIHRGLGAVAVALLLVWEHVAQSATLVPMTMVHSSPMGSPDGPSAARSVVVAATTVVLYSAFSLWLVMRHVRVVAPGSTGSGSVSPGLGSRSRTVLVVDVAAMAICVVLMALVPAFG